MAQDRKEPSFNDALYGVIVPTAVALLILGVAMLSVSSLAGLRYALLEPILVVGVPMLFGLMWSQWAGGASGFLLGSIYALFYSDQLYASQGRTDIILLGNLVSAMLIGYVAGALNKRSGDYRRMFISGVTSAIVGSIPIFVASWFSPVMNGVTITGFALTLLPRILAGVLVPLSQKASCYTEQGAKELCNLKWIARQGSPDPLSQSFLTQVA